MPSRCTVAHENARGRASLRKTGLVERDRLNDD